MPCTYYIPTLEQRYPKEWSKIRKEISDQMISEGWSKHANKFNEVMTRKAKRLLITRYCL